MSLNKIKVWHNEATKKAAAIFGIPEEALTHDIYQAFEADVYPLYEVDDIHIREDLGRALQNQQARLSD